ncbi:MAG: hypothetical protein LBG65_07250 [Puniceicoccales bacterium]|jgi:hypothetical protein|nr:hypothetical protein [Puniceicoccales bacterium]
MINELFNVATAMADAGITSPDWHPKLNKLKKSSEKEPCLRIWLTSDGRIDDVEAMPVELTAQLRKFEPDAGKSLPGFNLCPLFRIVKSEDEIKNAAKKLTASFVETDFSWEAFLSSANAEDFWDRTRSVLRQLKERVLPDMKKMFADKISEDEAISVFLNAFGKIDIEQFRNDYAAKVMAKAMAGTLPIGCVCHFVDQRKKRKEDTDSKTSIPKPQIFIDVRDYKEFSLSHPKSIARLNALLLAGNAGASSSESSGWKDAFGRSTTGVSRKFPAVQAPVLGGVILRSQVKAIPAQARYDLCDFKTFPAGDETRKRIKAAFEWISDDARNGATFGVAGDKELLFAFPRRLPKSRVPLASLFGVRRARENMALQEEKFERLAETVIEQLKGSGSPVADDTELNIFSLRKMDKARTKVVYYRNISVPTLEGASSEWNLGFQNLPCIEILDWSREKNENGKNFPEPVQFETMFPLHLHKILNTVWTLDKDNRNGAKQSAVRIFEPSDGMRLLLDAQEKSFARRIIERFLNHARTYFVVLCRAKGRNEIASLPDKSLCVGILGLLLFKLGKTKENYMNESAYQLGRFLRVADEIHRLYCEIVRRKKDGSPDLPPELCGSSLLTSMLEAPARTLDQLAMRSAPYVKWARAYHGDERAKLVHYWMHQWSQVADALHETTWPGRPSPEERAQVFLGYLSSFPKNEPTSTTETAISPTTQPAKHINEEQQ